jgi:prepilin-type N-terminal cleavage/methylation domain-containing protein
MMIHNTQTGLTLIELIMVIIIAAVIAIPLGVLIFETAHNAILPEHLMAGSSLLEEHIEEVTNRRFSDLETLVGTGESGNCGLGNYTYNINPYYVNAGALNTQVAGPTDYLRIEVTVSRAGFPDVSAVTLVTDN